METKELLKRCDLGYDAHHFIQSPLGQYLLNRALTERDCILDDLEQTDPHDFKAVMALQQRLEITRLVPRWLVEAVELGRQAGQEYEADQQGDAYDG